jgi:hypothetical protein
VALYMNHFYPSSLTSLLLLLPSLLPCLPVAATLRSFLVTFILQVLSLPVFLEVVPISHLGALDSIFRIPLLPVDPTLPSQLRDLVDDSALLSVTTGVID